MVLPKGFLQISNRVRNWGRWGDDDQLGTLNFITSEVVKNAAGCIRTGERFPLAVTLEKEGLYKSLREEQAMAADQNAVLAQKT